MHIHILGICGTFMGGIALLARAKGFQVSGSDANVYPPMSTQLEEAGIELMQGYDPEHLKPAPDCVVVGNAMSRGNPAVEYMLDAGLKYTSGPQWLAEHVLHDKWVLAVAGTHGKTSTASLLAWILEDAGMAPGFLIGGVPENFGISARLGDTPFFVVEADEYDTAFFDKRSKFVHYHPRTLVMNNLEFDHADIFDDLLMIQRQFHHLVRTVPSNGLLIVPEQDQALQDVLDMGCWTPVERFNVEQGGEATWEARQYTPDATQFQLCLSGKREAEVAWDLTGKHSMSNALAAIAAARHVGVTPQVSVDALSRFKNVKRRMELKGEVGGIKVYDDFAHHPTAIATTLNGLRAQVGEDEKIIAVLEPRSNTMRMGVHAGALADSLKEADEILIYTPDSIKWDANTVVRSLGGKAQALNDVQAIIDSVKAKAKPGNRVLIMSNGGFDNIHQRLLEALQNG